jgi:hypothetical protein
MRIHSYFGSKIAAALSVGLCVLLAAGCTRRVRLTPEELLDLDRRIADYERRKEIDPNTPKEQMFVYTHRRFIVKYERVKETAFAMGHKVDLKRERETPITLVYYSLPGQIIAREESNGVPLLWVSFDECDAKECAFGFVRTEDNRHKLAYVPAMPFVPPQEGFKIQALYRRYERPRSIMKKAKVNALGEANEVYVVKRKRRVKTIFLDVKKRVREKEQRILDVKEGRPEGTDAPPASPPSEPAVQP